MFLLMRTACCRVFLYPFLGKMTEVWAELSAYEGEFDLEKENCILISSGKNWMEQAAKDQLLAVSRLPGVVKAVGLPDLHPGRIPVGTAVLSRGVLYPHLLGNDLSLIHI